MELSDKIRRAAFTLAVGSMGAGIGYLANDVVEIIGEMRQEAAAKEEAHREYMKRMTNQYVPPPSNYQPPKPDPGFYCLGLICAM